MPKDSEQLNAMGGRRTILVADDEMINRELLGEMLSSDYNVVFACDGGETMEMIREGKNTLSLVLLDILMPVMTGLEILKEVKKDEELSRIPIIVTTADPSTEIESLKLGALDYITKPYPAVGVIKARIQRIIELSEDRDIIHSTERDELTGLYNREYFFRYATQYDHFHKDTEMDAVIVDVNRFHVLNERFGRSYGNEILKRISTHIKESIGEGEGLVCRRDADTFMIYCRHRDDYQDILDNASVTLAADDSSEDRVHLRMGVYPMVGKSIDIERRFDRAKMAADSVKGNLVNPIGYFDKTMHEQEMYAEQLIEAFPKAIESGQFQVYYQPKFDIRPEVPMLSSAEALVRWMHPDLGMISPGVFIPLFEDNGLIRRLDNYVWNETSRQIGEWREKYDYTVPVSVNVSRVDLYDKTIKQTLTDIVRSHGISEKELYLEVTESAYTRDSKQIVEMVEDLRMQGFQIEMDDFGTGYSSLNMISELPIDALKLDMQFIRNAFRHGGNIHMLEVIIGISDYLSVPVIAEGVETAEQLHALKALGCDLVQGYFFSKPVPAVEFEPFILQKKEAEVAVKKKPADSSDNKASLPENDFKPQFGILKGASETASEEGTAAEYVDDKKKGITLRTISTAFSIVAAIIAFGIIMMNFAVSNGYRHMEAATSRYISAEMAATDLEIASDFLTDKVRCFVMTGEVGYLEDFFEEVEITRRRDLAVENLEELLGDSDSTALATLNKALELSNELVEVENKALRLMAESIGLEMDGLPETIQEISLTDEEMALSAEEKQKRAQILVFDDNYTTHKDRIIENVSLCTQGLLKSSNAELEQATSDMNRLLVIQAILTVIMLLLVLAIVIIITEAVRKPLTNMVHKMQAQEFISPVGVGELRFVTRTYNQILDENNKARERLNREASHDALTGLFNRGAYNLLIESADIDHMALILIDVDDFKGVNDTYGHDVGDKILKRVADLLKQSFRSVDIICRIGGDEFVVVMTRVNSEMRQLVLNKINRINESLQYPKDDLPPVSLSVGVAFADRENPEGDIFQDADTALYRVKNRGRKGCEIF